MGSLVDRSIPIRPAGAEFGRKVFEYSDYRSFLIDYLRYRRQTRRGYSLGQFARDLQLKDASSINKILKGQRNPGMEVQKRLCHYFQFRTKETKYFFDLVALSKENKDSPNRMYILERLKRLHPSRMFRDLSAEEFQSMSQWHYMAIRELAKTNGFRNDPLWIADRLMNHVSATEVKEAIDALVKLQLLSRDGESLTATESRFQTPFDVPNEALKRFHERLLELARASIRKVPTMKRQISASTLSIKRKDIEQAKQIVLQAQHEICKLVEANPGDGEELYQLNVQFFPLTRTREMDLISKGEKK